jgi:hypothetical protein
MQVTTIWRKQPGKYFCICTKSQGGLWREHWFSTADFRDVRDFIRDNDDKDIYFCPHGFNKKTRKREYAVAPLLLWADLDEATPHGMRPKPTIALESSPGRFVGFWYTDKPVSDDINRQLTYALGADKGGWDYTQVLRVPGTTNYKYKSRPTVRVLWDDGPIWKLDKILTFLPSQKRENEEAPQELKAQDVYQKYEKVIPRWLRKEIVAGRPVSGARSDMLWKMEHGLIDCGLSSDEAFVLIKNSAWNKFRDRRNGDEQLKRELDKATSTKLDAGIKPESAIIGQGFMNGLGPKPSKGFEILARRMTDIDMKKVDWLWYPYLARGEVTIFEGDPGVGKSWAAQSISVHVADGKKLPRHDRWYKTPRAPVVYCDIENQADTVTRWRVHDMGLENGDNYIQVEEVFSIDDEDKFEAFLDFLEQVKPSLVVFDTINSYIGGADIFRSNEVTQAFSNFIMVARRFNCAVIVLRHLTKSSKDKAIYRGQGSMSFAGSARIMCIFAKMDDGRIAMHNNKNNLTKEAPVLPFELEECPSLKNPYGTRVVWGTHDETINGEDLFKKNDDKKGGKEGGVKEAQEMLLDMLDAGPRDYKDLDREREKRDISKTTLDRAAKKLNVLRRQHGFGPSKGSKWELPPAKKGSSSNQRNV